MFSHGNTSGRGKAGGDRTYVVVIVIYVGGWMVGRGMTAVHNPLINVHVSVYYYFLFIYLFIYLFFFGYSSRIHALHLDESNLKKKFYSPYLICFPETCDSTAHQFTSLSCISDGTGGELSQTK